MDLMPAPSIAPLTSLPCTSSSPQSIDENKLQVKAKYQQAINTANEQANLTLLDKLKKVYRDLQKPLQYLGHRHQYRRHRHLRHTDGHPHHQQPTADHRPHQCPPCLAALGLTDGDRVCPKSKRPRRLCRRIKFVLRRRQPNAGLRPEIAF
jgi:hypothetical protein